jgi:hypothetical protein
VVTALVGSVALGCDIFGPGAGIHVVSGANGSDTVLSIFKLPLTVQLLGHGGNPLSGQTVYFNTNGFVLVAQLDDPGFATNRQPVITDGNGDASVLIEAKQYAGIGKVVVVAPSGESVSLYYTVRPGAPALVRSEPIDTALYVGGTETYRPFITDAYGNRVPISPAPAYQYQSLNGALSITGGDKATGVAIGRGSVSVTAMGFTDTMWTSVVPKGRIAINESYIVETNLDGSVFDTIPNPSLARTLDWSEVNSTFVYDATSGHLVLQDTTGHAHVVITNPLMRSEYYPRYAHDGSNIYFSGIDSLTNCWGIWRVHPDGTVPEHVVADTVSCGPYAYTSGPAPYWGSSPSPDGTRVVYVGERNIPYVGGILRVRTLATGADTSLGVAGAFPRWSPRGEWIAYDSLGKLMLIHPDGTGHQVLLDRGDVFVRGSSWSPDGEWLLYTGDKYYGCPDRTTCFTGLKIVQVGTGLTLHLPYTAFLSDGTWLR